MRIQVMSDLHLDTQKQGMPLIHEFIREDADLVVFAGDVVEYDSMTKFLKELLIYPNQQFLWILGNHEYYEGHADLVLKNARDKIKKLGLKNVRILENESATFSDADGNDEFRIIGSTLWTDIQRNPSQLTIAKMYMNDFRKIRGMSSDWWQERFHESCKYIVEELIANKEVPTIVVTHHSPSLLAIPGMYKGHPTNVAYASDLEDMFMEDWAPNIWVHGHTHDAYDQEHGYTRIIRNPYGYRSFGEYTHEFNKNFIIEYRDGQFF